MTGLLRSSIRGLGVCNCVLRNLFWGIKMARLLILIIRILAMRILCFGRGIPLRIFLICTVWLGIWYAKSKWVQLDSSMPWLTSFILILVMVLIWDVVSNRSNKRMYRTNFPAFIPTFFGTAINVSIIGLLLLGNSAVIGWPESVWNLKHWIIIAISVGAFWGYIMSLSYNFVLVYRYNHPMSLIFKYGELINLYIILTCILLGFFVLPSMWLVWGTTVISTMDGGIWIILLPFVMISGLWTILVIPRIISYQQGLDDATDKIQKSHNKHKNILNYIRYIKKNVLKRSDCQDYGNQKRTRRGNHIPAILILFPFSLVVLDKIF